MHATEEKIEHKSRWGYHPCDYQTYVKLRKLHKLMWRMMRQLGRYRSWDRKLPQNQGPEPKVCPVAYELGLKIDPYTHKIYPNQDLRADYLRARYPQPEPVVSFQGKSDWMRYNDLDKLLSAADEWFAEIGK